MRRVALQQALACDYQTQTLPRVQTPRPLRQQSGRYMGCTRLADLSLRPKYFAVQQSSSNWRMTGRARLQVTALFEKFTERSIKSVMLAQEMSRTAGADQVAPEHILLGLMAEDTAKSGFLHSGVTADTARAIVDSLQSRTVRREQQKDLPFSVESKQVFETALMESRRMGMSFISPEHIFLAILECADSDTIQLMDALGLEPDVQRLEALRRLKGEAEGEGTRKKVAAASTPSRQKAKSEGGTQALEEFCIDLNARAKDKKLDPVIGRDKEVARVAQILARRSKNNPVLLGEPGVGKTAIAEGLANAIVTGMQADGTPLPTFLVDKRVMCLDVGLLIAGAKERGELESRVTRILDECKTEGNIILVIDEIHTLVGAGAVGRGGGGGLDIANLLKPALARAHLQCIGATTLDEYRKHIEKDAALERRFQPVVVDEPSEAETLEILEGLVERYERYHRCVYSSDALLAAVRLSSRYIADRFLPDKAIDIVDEAGSRARIATYKALKEAGGDRGEIAAASYNELISVMDTKDEAIKDSLFEEATLLRSRELELKAKLTGEPEEGPAVPVVTAAHIEAVVAAWTQIPVEKMSADDRERLTGLADALGDRVIGQEEAAKATSRAVGRAAAGIKHPNRPIAAMLFSGPTGVGKTELARVLAEHHFGSSSSLIRLDMSEYMERHTVSKLIGSPPGYIGFGEGGKLTEAVRRRPFSLILFDEIEKAHPDVFNILLQVLEEGRLTDSQGRTVSFKNALIVLTSNVGSSVIAKGGGGIGFELPSDNNAEDASYTRMRSLVMEELKNYFRPELLNRLDEVVVFHKLNRDHVRVIAALELAKTEKRAAERGIDLRITSDIIDFVASEGYSDECGARELRRVIARTVDDALSDAILSGRINTGDVAVLAVRQGGVIEVVSEADLVELETVNA